MDEGAVVFIEHAAEISAIGLTGNGCCPIEYAMRRQIGMMDMLRWGRYDVLQSHCITVIIVNALHSKASLWWRERMVVGGVVSLDCKDAIYLQDSINI